LLSANKDRTLVIIGLDGLSSKTAELVGLGSAVHDLVSTIPPYTPPSWTSILTGVNPAKHGIIGWQKMDSETGRVSLVTSRDVRYPRLPQMLSQKDLRSVLVNVPLTYPFHWADSDRMTIVSDWAAPRQAIFPSKTEREYREYLVEPPHQWARTSAEDYVEKVREYTERRMELYHELIQTLNWNLFFVVFSETDWLFHAFPEILQLQVPTACRAIFRMLKEFISEAMSLSDYGLIVSDHGFRIVDRIFYLNEALADAGFATYKRVHSRLMNYVKRRVPQNLLRRICAATHQSVSAVSYVLKNAEACMFEPGTWGIHLRPGVRPMDVRRVLTEYSEIEEVVSSATLYRGQYLRELPQLFAIPARRVAFSHNVGRGLMEKTWRGEHDIRGVFCPWGEAIQSPKESRHAHRVYDIVPTVLRFFGLPIPADIDGRPLEGVFQQG